MTVLDWGQASRSVGEAYFSHRLTPLVAGADPARVAVRRSDLGPVRVVTIDWGSPVVVDTRHPDGYAVNLPLTGMLRSRIRTRGHVADTGHATVYPPDTAVTIDGWPPSCQVLGVRFDTGHVRREAQRLFGRPVVLPAELEVMRAVPTGWMPLVRLALTHPVAHPLMREQLAGAIITSFLLAVVPEEPGGNRVGPRAVRRVIERMHHEPERAWAAADMAEAAGVGIRRLQEEFRGHLGMTPREYLTGVRLAGVRNELSETDGAARVTDIALRWGFTHMGRFAAVYRRAYGEAPSETLRRSSS